MTATPTIRNDAEQDILEASRWYEDREAGLGLEFIRSIDTCLTQILPRSGPGIFRQATLPLHPRVRVWMLPEGVDLQPA